MSWTNYMFPGVSKTDPMTRLSPSTDEEIIERISASAHTPQSVMGILSSRT